MKVRLFFGMKQALSRLLKHNFGDEIAPITIECTFIVSQAMFVSETTIFLNKQHCQIIVTDTFPLRTHICFQKTRTHPNRVRI